MKTISDAARVLVDQDAVQRFTGIAEEIAFCPELLRAVIQILGSNGTRDQQLLQVLAVGVCVGMEMERP